MDVNNAQLNADLAATLVAALVEGGVREAVISPGSRSTPLVLALAAAEAALRLHVQTDERTAGFFALGLARASGTPVALVCTSGSAPAHYLPAVVEASEDLLPLVVVSADRPPELHGCGAGQTVDQQRLFGGFVRHFRELGGPSPGVEPAWVAGAVAAALAAATGARPGPVHLNVPFREPLWAPGVVGRAARGTRVVAPAAAEGSDDGAWRVLREALAGRRRIVIVAGTQRWAGLEDLHLRIASCARRLGAPVLAEAASQCRFGAAPAVVHAAEALLRAPAFVESHRPDAVIRLGRTPTSRTVQAWVNNLPRSECLVVQIDPHGEAHDPGQRADLRVTASPFGLTRALAEAEAGDPAWLGAWRSADDLACTALEASCADGFWAGPVARRLAANIPQGDALHVASSMPIRDLDAFAGPRAAPLAVFANRGANGIDGTVATGLGVQASGRFRRTWVLCGDLALLHDVGSLVAVRGRRLDATVVVVNNGGGGIFGFLPIAAGLPDGAFERFFFTPHEADFEAIARAAGARFTRAVDLAAYEAALAAESRTSGLGLIECLIDRTHDRTQHTRAWAAVARALQAGSTPELT